MDNNRIRITQPFNEQYTLYITTDAMLINASMESKACARYDFSVLEVTEDYFECRLVQLEHKLLESNNDFIKEISLLTSSFNKMFNELHLRLEHNGEILEVLNLELIQAKWEQTKKEMQEISENNENIKKVLLLNDHLFTHPDKIKTGIKAIEFFQMYFGHYFDVRIPSNRYIQGTNILNTANLEWDISLRKEKTSNQPSDIITLISEGSPKKLKKEFYNSAYRAFSDKIDMKNLASQLYDNAIVKIDISSGRLIESDVKKVELVTPTLYNKMKYSFMCDEIYLHKLSPDKKEDKSQNNKTLPPGYVNIFDL